MWIESKRVLNLLRDLNEENIDNQILLLANVKVQN